MLPAIVAIRLAASGQPALRFPCFVLVGEAPVTTGPGDHVAAAAAGRGHLRASHADREQVIDTLKAAYVQGRLTKDELDLRLDQTFTSRTYAELAALTADIPAGLAGDQPLRTPARAPTRQPVNKAVKWGVGACAVIPPAGLAVALLTENEGLARLFGPIMVIYFMALLIAGAQVLDSRHQERSRLAATAAASTLPKQLRHPGPQYLPPSPAQGR
jgi:hypothetical protein